MPIIKSAKKRVRIAEKATIRNRKTKRTMKEAIKALQANLKGDKKNVGKLYQEAQSAIDTAVKKNVIHKNKAARKKSQLASTIKEQGAKLTTAAKKSTPSKTTKQSTTKKSIANTTKSKPAKKTITKKPVPKK